MANPNRRVTNLRYAPAIVLALAAVLVVIVPVQPGLSSAGMFRTAFAGASPNLSTTVFNALVPPAFGPNVRANEDATIYGQHEPSLAVSRVNTNTVVAASKDYRANNVKQVWIYSSTDGGTTWPVQ